MKLSLKTTPLTWYKDKIKDKITALQEYLKIIEKEEAQIVDLQKELSFDEDGVPLSSELYGVDKNPEWDNLTGGTYLDSYRGLYSDHIPDMVRYGALIVLYSIFEAEMMNLCRYLSSFSKLRLKYKDIESRNGYIGKSKKYLIKVVEIDIEQGNEVWKDILFFRSIRNKVVHKNGVLHETNDKKLLESIAVYAKANSNFFNLDKIGKSCKQIRVRIDFLQYALKQFNEYFEIIHEALVQKYSNECT